MKKENMRRARRFNWFDWMLVSLLVLAVTGGFFAVRYVVGRSDGTRGVVTYRIILTDREERVIEGGKTVRSQNGTVVLGEVLDVQREAHRFSSVKNGTVVISEAEDRWDYFVTVRAEGRKKEGDGIRVGDIRIAAGASVSVRIGDLLVPSAVIGSVEWEDLHE